jgi:hypothetical protein
MQNNLSIVDKWIILLSDYNLTLIDPDVFGLESVVSCPIEN